LTEPTVFPEDSDEGWSEPSSDEDDVQRLLDERPPHHDRG
jgi:hypothetical protein